MKANDLAKELLKAKEAYYKGASHLTDAQFDELEAKLRAIDAGHSYFKVVGSPVLNYGKKVAHEIPMKSLQKANSTEDIVKWLKRCGISESSNKLNLVGMPKFDGNSCSIQYDKGKLQVISTRGDGLQGQDITETMSLSKDIPRKISYIGKLEIRGELYLPKTYKSESNLRNVVSGLIHRKEMTEEMKEIKFVAYEVYGEDSLISMTEKFHFIKRYLPNVTPFKVIRTLKEAEEWFDEHNKGERNNYDLDLDGLVLCFDAVLFQQSLKNDNDHHNAYNIAWKFDNVGEWIDYDHTEWNLSRHGNYVPKAYVKTTIIQGREITKASLDNARNFLRLSPGPKSKVYVTVNNDIIPRIQDIMDPEKEPDLPTHCPSCSTEFKWTINKKKEKVHLRCYNKECKGQNFEKVVYWVKSCKMDGVSDQTVEKLFDSGLLKKLDDLYTLHEHKDELLSIDGFGDSKVVNLLEQIEKSRKLDCVQLIDNLGIESVGDKAVRKLGIETPEDFLAFDDSTYKTGQKIIEWKEDEANIELFETLISILDISKEKVKKKSGGLRCCCTGKGPADRKDLIAMLEAKGYEWIDSVGKETDILVTDDLNSDSAKMKKAKKLGIKIMTYKEIL